MTWPIETKSVKTLTWAGIGDTESGGVSEDTELEENYVFQASEDIGLGGVSPLP